MRTDALDQIVGYEGFASAIVEQAHRDYIEALLLENKAMRILKKASELKSSVLTFYGTDWYYALTKLDPAELLRVARIQADYLLWKRNKWCSSCTKSEKECVHRAAGCTNWKHWDKGYRICMREEEKKNAKGAKQTEPDEPDELDEPDEIDELDELFDE